MAKIAIIKFPGTNCDEDVYHVLKNVIGLDAEIVWYREYTANTYDAVIIPGGFSYGDWLRAGAIAARSETLERIADDIARGAPTLGICNGFQILVEAGLLPGALLPNDSGKFVCRWVKVVVENPRGPWLSLARDGQVIDMPVAHAEGRYYIDSEAYSRLLGRASILRYARGWNPNGSLHDIAGIGSDNGLVLGLMPHPERASEPELVPRGFGAGGRVIFESLAHALKKGW